MRGQTQIPLPEMSVEIRTNGKTHGIPAPDNSADNMAKQLQQTMQLNNDAKIGGWPETTLQILLEYMRPYLHDIKSAEIVEAVQAVTGFDSWQDLGKFFATDHCSEFFTMAHKYVIREGQEPEKKKDFLDGTGFGYLNYWRRRAEKVMDKIFDAKSAFERRRPLVYFWEQYGIDYTQMANAMHPGHYDYPTGHSGKILSAVQCLREIYEPDKPCSRQLFIAGCIASLSRSASFIHFVESNLIGGHLCGLDEMQAFKIVDNE